MAFGTYVSHDKVLRHVNQARTILGLSSLTTLPRGRQRDHGDCPIAHALDMGSRISTDKLYLYDAMVEGDVDDLAKRIAAAWRTGYRKAGDNDGLHATVDLPRSVCLFVERFDAGKVRAR